MDPRQTKSDDRDSKRVLGWGVMAVIVLVLLALLGLYWISAKGRAPGVEGATPQTPHSAPANAPAK
ncbi:hypothetical protein J7E62_28140 [Variovorax paradoxus]|nr:hypothetical protein [Variovorax paradoxus]